MSVNEFEKQIQQTMSGWKLPPGENVWVEVEKRIRKEKRRRGLIILFFSILLLGGGITAFLLTRKNNDQEIAQAKPSNTKAEQNKEASSLTTQNNNLSDKKITQTDSVADPDKKITTAVNERIITKDSKSIVEFNSQNAPIVKKKKTSSIKQQETTELSSPVKKDNVPVEEPQTEIKSIVEKNNPNKQIETENEKVNKTNVIDQPVEKKTEISSEPEKIDSVTKKPDVAITPADSTASKNKTEKKKSKIDWTLNIQQGRSSYVKGLGLFTKRSYYQFASAPGGGSPTYAESPRPGFSLALTLQAHQELSRKISMNYSGGYNYLSTRQRVGSSFDTSLIVNSAGSSGMVDASYRLSGTGTMVSNQFHFLDLSASLSWKIVDRKKFSLFWNNGIQYDWLIASRVLFYDPANKVFYKNPKLLTHHHIFLNTSLTFPVSKRVSLSPFAAYSLTPVNNFNRGDSARTHFGNYGLRINISFSKRK